jgi:uncharacterized protein YndB with AHSA1/START domain
MPDLKHQIPINATPEKVYAALTTEKGLRGWWTADSKTEDRVGGKAEFGFDKRGTVFHMTIDNLQSPQLVVWSCSGDHLEWKGTTLTWNIAAESGITVLRFTHANWRAATEYYAMCNSSWGELMYRLKDYVEGRKPGPHWKD